MRRFFKARYLIFVILLVLFSLSPKTSMSIRETSISVLTTSKNFLGKSVMIVFKPIKKLFPSKASVLQQEINELKFENYNLKQQIYDIEEMLKQEQFINYQLDRLERFVSYESASSHYKKIQKLFQQQVNARLAKVVYRDSSSWNSSIWVKVDKDSNGITVNSPVVIGNMLIGLVDYVGDDLARIRLITDSALTPSVRVARGSAKMEMVQDYIAYLQDLLSDIYIDDKLHVEEMMTILTEWQKDLNCCDNKNSYLAKGVVQGYGAVLGRKEEHKLRGIGFNYNYADDEGPERDLRSGAIINAVNDDAKPIIMAGDILITTGMDGIFPSGLKVAYITKVLPLEEGNCYYNIEANPLFPSFNNLEYVYVLPAIKM